MRLVISIWFRNREQVKEIKIGYADIRNIGLHMSGSFACPSKQRYIVLLTKTIYTVKLM